MAPPALEQPRGQQDGGTAGPPDVTALQTNTSDSLSFQKGAFCYRVGDAPVS